jgi:hypothetical protein
VVGHKREKIFVHKSSLYFRTLTDQYHLATFLPLHSKMARVEGNGYHPNGDKRQTIALGIDEETLNSGAEGYDWSHATKMCTAIEILCPNLVSHVFSKTMITDSQQNKSLSTIPLSWG